MSEVVIEFTERLRKDYRALPKRIQEKLKKQVGFLAENPRHPSLRTHRIRGSDRYWEFYIDDAWRCVFRREGNVYYLIAAGTHRVIDEFARR